MTEDTALSKSDRTRRAIMQSAYALFTSQGYAATSMRQIAEGAGLALGSIYNHFASKEDMFAAVIAENHPFLQIMPMLINAHGDSIDEFLRSAAKRLVEELDNRPEFINLMLIELVEFKGQHASKLFEKIFPDVMAIAARVSGFQDDMRPIPTLLLMRAFLGMFFSYFMTDLLLKGLMTPDMQENALDRFVDIFLNGVKRPAQALPSDSNPRIITETP